jgi:hypothetical protein
LLQAPASWSWTQLLFTPTAFLILATMNNPNMPMSEKIDREYTLPTSNTRREMPPRRLRTWTGGFAVVAVLYLAWNYSYGTRMSMPSDTGGQWYKSARARGKEVYERRKETLQQDLLGTEVMMVTNKHLVPLEAHIMSKCPDARVR